MEKKIIFHQGDRDVMNEGEKNFAYFWIFLTLFPTAFVLSQLHFLEPCSVENELQIISLRQESCFSNEALMRRDPDIEQINLSANGGIYGDLTSTTTSGGGNFPGIS